MATIVPLVQVTLGPPPPLLPQADTIMVDRLKRMINASGYKVWPRVVEDGLLAHPAVREAAAARWN